MSSPRIFGDASARNFYHCVSRVVDRRILFHADEKEVFRSILRKLEQFSGLRVATYCFMGNHFHLLIEVPDRSSIAPLDSRSLLELLPLLYDKATVETVTRELAVARESGNASWEKAILARYEHRRGDLSIFLKEFKQRISIFMNRRLGRVGTLWEGRFRSVLVEGGESSLHAVAAYIDLNPVRAGLVSKPEDYRWSGFGEASGSGKGATRARLGLGLIQRELLERPDPTGPAAPLDWSEVEIRYRRLLDPSSFEGVTDNPEPAHTSSSGTSKMKATPGASPCPPRRGPSLPEMLRRKIRYFCDGAVIGTSAFIEETIARLKTTGQIPPNRKSSAQRLRGGVVWGELRSLRGLQVNVFGPPPRDDPPSQPF